MPSKESCTGRHVAVIFHRHRCGKKKNDVHFFENRFRNMAVLFVDPPFMHSARQRTFARHFSPHHRSSATASHATAAISAKDNRTKVSSSTKKLTKEERAAEREQKSAAKAAAKAEKAAAKAAKKAERAAMKAKKKAQR
jgi:hypothetical protein